LLKPVRDWAVGILRIDRESFAHRAVKCIVTFLLVNLAWVFFRADSMAKALDIIGSSCRFTPWVFTDGSLFRYGLDQAGMMVLLLGSLLLFAVDIVSYRGTNVREKILEMNLFLRWAIVIPAILIILLCGIWGAGYDASSFIYQQF
nr:MBOAT family protein [Butyrivibrio sp.]